MKKLLRQWLSTPLGYALFLFVGSQVGYLSIHIFYRRDYLSPNFGRIVLIGLIVSLIGSVLAYFLCRYADKRLRKGIEDDQ